MRDRATDAGEWTGLQAQGIAHVIESDTVGELRVEQADDMTPRAEGAGFFIRFGLAGIPGHQKFGIEVANLSQKIQFGRRWDSWFFIHPCRVAGLNKLFQHYFQNSVGWLNARRSGFNSRVVMARCSARVMPRLSLNLMAGQRFLGTTGHGSQLMSMAKL